MAEYEKVAELKDVPPGSVYHVEMNGDQIALANVNGQIYALGGVCTHRGGPLGQGELSGEILTCPWHGGQFNVRTGEVVGPPPTEPVPTYPVQVEGNDIKIARA